MFVMGALSTFLKIRSVLAFRSSYLSHLLFHARQSDASRTRIEPRFFTSPRICSCKSTLARARVPSAAGWSGQRDLSRTPAPEGKDYACESSQRHLWLPSPHCCLLVSFPPHSAADTRAAQLGSLRCHFMYQYLLADINTARLSASVSPPVGLYIWL